MSELESFERDFNVHRYSFRRNRVMKVVYLIESDVLLSCLAEISSSDLSRRGIREIPDVSGITFGANSFNSLSTAWAITI